MSGDPIRADLVDEVRIRRLVIVDDAGQERIVAEVTRGHAEVRLLLADCRRGHESMVALSAGSDSLFGPMVGVHLWAEGEQLGWFSAWRDAADPWRAYLGGPALEDHRPGRPR